MRIIGGKMKGTKLQTLSGYETTRPTLDRVKESLFNILNFKISESIVLDLFSGSGALGIEAISRGAKKAYLCDESKQAINIIKQNVTKTKCNEFVQIINKKSKNVLEILKSKNIKFDIIFLDPPYKTNLAIEAAEYIICNNLLNKDGIIIIETDDKDKIIEILNEKKIEIHDIRKYGRVFLIFLCERGK